MSSQMPPPPGRLSVLLEAERLRPLAAPAAGHAQPRLQPGEHASLLYQPLSSRRSLCRAVWDGEERQEDRSRARSPSPRGPGLRLRWPSTSLKPTGSASSPQTGRPVAAAAGPRAGRTRGQHGRAGAGVGGQCVPHDRPRLPPPSLTPCPRSDAGRVGQGRRTGVFHFRSSKYIFTGKFSFTK